LLGATREAIIPRDLRKSSAGAVAIDGDVWDDHALARPQLRL